MPAVQEPGANGKPKEVHKNTHTRTGMSGVPTVLPDHDTLCSLRETEENKAGCQAAPGSEFNIHAGSSSVCRENNCHPEGNSVSR